VAAPKPEPGERARRWWRGGALVLFAAAGFSLHNVITRLAFDAGSNALTVLAVRCLFAVVAIAAVYRWRGQSLRLPRHTRLVAMALGCVLALQSYGIIGAIQYIPVSLAILILYTYPIIVALLSPLTDRQPITAAKLIAFAGAFIGVALALDVSFTGLQWQGLALAATAAAAMTCTVIASGRIARSAGSVALTFHMISVAGALYIIALTVRGGPALPAEAAGWLALAAVPITYLVAILSFFAGIAAVGGLRLSMIMNSEPVITIALAVAILGEQLTPTQLAGAALVVAAIVLARRSSAPAVRPATE